MYFLSDVYEAQFAKIKVARKLHNRVVNGKVFAVKGSSFWRQGASTLFEKVGNKRRVFGTAENRIAVKNILENALPFDPDNIKPKLKRSGLTPLEAESMFDYLQQGYHDINGYNFDSGLNKENGVKSFYVNKGLKKLKRANVDNLPDWLTPKEKNKDLIRYVRINDKGLDKWLDGFKNGHDNKRMSVKDGVLTTKHPLSTALNAPKYFGKSIDGFMDFDPSTETQVKFKIKRKKNTEGRWLGDINPTELEVLYPSGTKFKVKKIKEYESLKEPVGDNYSKDGYEIWLDEL